MLLSPALVLLLFENEQSRTLLMQAIQAVRALELQGLLCVGPGLHEVQRGAIVVRVQMEEEQCLESSIGLVIEDQDWVSDLAFHSPRDTLMGRNNREEAHSSCTS